MMKKIILITPPFVQPNAPYPATSYLKGYLGRETDAEVVQHDLSIDLLNDIFSSSFLGKLFSHYATLDDAPRGEDGGLERLYSLRRVYLRTIDPVMRFLRGQDDTMASLICTPDFLPQSSRFGSLIDIEENFGRLGTQDCARHLATLYLQDISDFIRATVSEHFEIVRYGETLSLSVAMFSQLKEQLDLPLNMIEERMVALLDGYLLDDVDDFKTSASSSKDSAKSLYSSVYIGFSVPFPGNLIAALRCAEHIKKHHTKIKTIMGGGYPTTELRSMSDRAIFDYFDYVVLDDGELALKRILDGGELVNTYTIDGYHSSTQSKDVVDCRMKSGDKISHMERGCPDFRGLPHDRYFSLFEVANPMHKMWSDGRWNKMTLAHGCYWANCAFCDTSLGYIGDYSADVDASTLVDWMEQVAVQTGSSGFHFTDEAAPPKLLRELSLEILRRGSVFSWWGNIRFEAAFTGDLCRLMAAAGCVAVSGGVEVANDRLLTVINKGVSIETATITLRNLCYSGIMTHAYLMYGLPTQTLQESVDSLEVVRQMFIAELIDSAFWHRFAMTVHSPMGLDPENYGTKRKNDHVNSFANNEVRFIEDRGYNINAVGDALREATGNYLLGSELERSSHKWFKGKAPQTTIENTLIVDHLIKPDRSRIFDPKARLVWIGSALPFISDRGVVVDTPWQQKEVKFSELDADFIVTVCGMCANLNNIVSFTEIEDLYKSGGGTKFSELYHSKSWDQMREFGLLQL